MKRQYARTDLKYYICILSGTSVLFFFDRFTKYLASVFLKGNGGVSIVKNVLKLIYVENTGAAFSILQNKQYFFYVLTSVFLLVCIAFLVKIPKTKYYLPVISCVTFLISGALGNFFDRLVKKYVVDFIYFELIDFPVFNLADIYLTLSIAFIFILIIFHYKEKDFDFIAAKGKNSLNE